MSWYPLKRWSTAESFTYFEKSNYAIQMSHWCHTMVDNTEFWISCKGPAFLRDFSHLQLQQNSAPSVTWWRQCYIRIEVLCQKAVSYVGYNVLFFKICRSRRVQPEQLAFPSLPLRPPPLRPKNSLASEAKGVNPTWCHPRRPAIKCSLTKRTTADMILKMSRDCE